MPSHPRFAAACAIVVAGLLPGHADAAPAGHLDPSFGTGGKTTVALPASVVVATLPKPGFALRDAAGRLYLADNPNATSDSPVLQIVRLHHDGTLDASFGNGGLAVTPVPEAYGMFGYLSAAALQPDGRLLVGLSNPAMVVCRLLPSGVLDSTFGASQTPGCVDIGGGNLRALAVQADRRIVVAGTTWNHEARVVRLMPEGVLDAGFGDDGSVLVDGIVDSGFEDVALAANGDILAAGWVQASNRDFLVMRLAAANGQKVAEFADGGVARIAFDAGFADHDSAYAIDVSPDGGIVVAGNAQTALPGYERAAVVKLTDSGARDLSFGPSGQRVFDPCVDYAFGCSMSIRDVAVLQDERLVLAGRVSPGSQVAWDFLAMRILADGTLDPTFKNDITPGTSTVAFDQGLQYQSDGASTVLLEGDRVLLTGIASADDPDVPNDYRVDFALARLDHGKNQLFSVTPVVGAHGTLMPAVAQQVLHSNRAEFVVVPAPGYAVATIGKAPGECGGGMDGDVYVTAPVVAHCTARITFKLASPDVFDDGFE